MFIRVVYWNNELHIILCYSKKLVRRHCVAINITRRSKSKLHVKKSKSTSVNKYR